MYEVCTAIYFIAKRKKMSDKGASELRVVIDLCYQNLMNEKVRNSHVLVSGMKS